MEKLTNYCQSAFSETIVSSYDTTLLKLKTPLNFSDKVSPIKLAREDTEPAGVATLSGWASVSTLLRVLRTAKAPIIDRQ